MNKTNAFVYENSITCKRKKRSCERLNTHHAYERKKQNASADDKKHPSAYETKKTTMHTKGNHACIRNNINIYIQQKRNASAERTT